MFDVFVGKTRQDTSYQWKETSFEGGGRELSRNIFHRRKSASPWVTPSTLVWQLVKLEANNSRTSIREARKILFWTLNLGQLWSAHAASVFVRGDLCVVFAFVLVRRFFWNATWKMENHLYLFFLLPVFSFCFPSENSRLFSTVQIEIEVDGARWQWRNV